jgi:hypothetical protein
MNGHFEFLLGLPALRPGALWARARSLDAPVLVSANARALMDSGYGTGTASTAATSTLCRITG